MKIPGIRIFAVILGVCLPLSLHATVDDLYQVLLPVADQSEQSVALHAALPQVLLKVTGKSAPAIALDEARLMSLVQGFAYREQPLWPGHAQPHSMQVTFMPAALDAFLAEQKLAKWSGRRPLVLVWLALENNGDTQWLNHAQEAQAVVEAVAAQRGLPLLFPLLDLEDWQALPLASLAQASEENVRRASLRYQADVILVAHARPAAQGWQSEWRVYSAAHPLHWGRADADLPSLLQDGIARLSDMLAVQYRGDANAPAETFELLIENVTHLDDYVRVQEYLDSLDIVSHATLLEADASRLHFRIDARGGVNAFARIAPLGGLLEAVEGVSGAVLVYRLRGG
jgi:uncharacterized protein